MLCMTGDQEVRGADIAETGGAASFVALEVADTRPVRLGDGVPDAHVELVQRLARRHQLTPAIEELEVIALGNTGEKKAQRRQGVLLENPPTQRKEKVAARTLLWWQSRTSWANWTCVDGSFCRYLCSTGPRRA